MAKKQSSQVLVPKEELNNLIEKAQILENLGDINEMTNKVRIVDDLMAEKIVEADKWKQRLAEIKSTMPGTDYMVTAALSAIYTRVTMLRKEIIQQIDRIRSFYITDVLLTQFADDALTPDVATGDVIDVHSENEALDWELTALDERIKFDSLVNDIIEDLLGYGEYTLKTELAEEGHGLKALVDDVDQTSVIAITEMGEISNYLVMDEKGTKAEIVEPHEYVKFMLGNRRLRIDLKNEMAMVRDKKLLKDIPRYVRIGKSMLFPIISKIKELELLEQLVPASKLAQLTANTLLGIQVPAGMVLEEAFQAARNVENQVNRKVGIDFGNKELTIQHIMTIAGRIKCIPVFGEGKGDLKRIDYRADEPKELSETAEDARKVICSSVGIPYELIFGEIGQGKKVDLLKRFARYLRRLKMIQKAVVMGILQICNIHLVNKKISYRPEDIKVDFLNTMINIDELDKLEFIDATVGMLKNIDEFMRGLTDDISSKHVIEKKYFEFLGDQLNIAGMGEVITDEIEEREPGKDISTEEVPVGNAEPFEPTFTPPAGATPGGPSIPTVPETPSTETPPPEGEPTPAA
jgi:hypothetical protein